MQSPSGKDHSGQLHYVARTERTQGVHGAGKGEDPDGDAKAKLHAFEMVHRQLLFVVWKLSSVTYFHKAVRQVFLLAQSIDEIDDALRVCLGAILVPQSLFYPTY